MTRQARWLAARLAAGRLAGYLFYFIFFVFFPGPGFKSRHRDREVAIMAVVGKASFLANREIPKRAFVALKTFVCVQQNVKMK